MGFHLENFWNHAESSLYSPYLLSKKDFTELLESPTYRLGISLEKSKQLISPSDTITLTTPEFDFTGKPTTPIDLGDKSQTISLTTSLPSVSLAKKGDLGPGKDYFKTKKKTFSVTELQEYVNCPYRYYARYQLKLGSLEADELEPASNEKGSFVHQVLYRLIKENESDYLEGLEYESFRKKIQTKLAQIVQEEIDKNETFKNFNQHVIEFYAYRVYKTIVELIDIEAQNYKSEKKKTIPKHYEFPFGFESKNNFNLETDHGSITLKGRIDRIDISRSHENFTVIDYKTGNVPTGTDLKTGKAIQLPLYLMAIQKILYPHYQPAGAYFYTLKENQIKGFVINPSADADLMHKRSQISPDQWEDIQQTVLERVNETVTGIYEGKFDPKPIEAKLCQFCDYRRICGYKI